MNFISKLIRYYKIKQLEKKFSFAKKAWVELPQNMYGHVFVFGSNLAGKHCGGAAFIAKGCYGAKDGVGQGPHGNSYAIPTLGFKFEPLQSLHLFGFIDEFLKEAKRNPQTTYHLTPIGCGIAGYKISDIAPAFMYATKNVILPIEFKEWFIDNYEIVIHYGDKNV